MQMFAYFVVDLHEGIPSMAFMWVPPRLLLATVDDAACGWLVTRRAEIRTYVRTVVR